MSIGRLGLLQQRTVFYCTIHQSYLEPIIWHAKSDPSIQCPSWSVLLCLQLPCPRPSRYPRWNVIDAFHPSLIFKLFCATELMVFLQVLTTSVVVALLWVVTKSIRRLFFHPLSHIPGPRLAALTWWYEFYYDVVLPGKYIFKIQELHREYGTLSFSSFKLAGARIRS